MSVWLGWLADAVHDEGCKTREWSGWQSRSASQGGFYMTPLGVIEHHTASPVSWRGTKDWDYATFNDSNGPEYNLGVDPDGTVNVLAAGGVNSSGKGGPLILPSGTVPESGANYRLVAISFGNTGDGTEPYSTAMIDAGVRATAAILRRLGLDQRCVTAHKIWCGPGTICPGRKVDPFGPWTGGGDWGPGQGPSSILDPFRNRVATQLADTTPPGPSLALVAGGGSL